MECPYKIPFEAVYLKLGEIWVIKDSEGKVIFWDITKEQADFLTEAINSHEKLETVVRHLISSATRYPDDYATKDLNKLIPYLIKEDEQAL